jgi:hypothetical protein
MATQLATSIGFAACATSAFLRFLHLHLHPHLHLLLLSTCRLTDQHA